MTKPKGRTKKYKLRQAVARKEFLEQRRRLFLRYGRILETLTKRREYMSNERRDCGNAQDGRPCATCKAPAPAIALDQCIQQLIKKKKITVGPKQPFNHPTLLEMPMVEYSRCPFFVANEALYFEAVTSPHLRSYLQDGYRQTCRGMAKEVKRAINAIRDRTSPHLRSLKLLIQMTPKSLREDPLWAIHDFINKIEDELPKLKARARSPAGPRGDPIRRSIYIAMLKVWKQLTGRLPATNNTTFHDFAHAALRSIDPNASAEYNYEAATKTALRSLK